MVDPLANTQCSSSQYDYVIVGSGFGGSVSAYRLASKGYKVLVVEKGRRYAGDRFAKTNWNLRKWLWMPALGLKGIMQVVPLRHVTAMSGVGVGGGSLVYGATLPRPKAAFFESGSWAGLADWKNELAEHYDTAEQMLGAIENPRLTSSDRVMEQLAKDIGREAHFRPSTVGIYFGDDSGQASTDADPFFGGEGPDRSPCIHCGRCMLGCPNNAKNSLDKNYLYLASNLGAEVVAETQVEDVAPAGDQSGSEGYFVSLKSSSGLLGRQKTIYAKSVVFSAGVLGTVPLLLKLKAKGSLPRLSDAIGRGVRTNNETITNVTSSDRSAYFTEGVTIGSIIEVDDHSHIEPIVQGPQSNAWKLLILPRAQGKNFVSRMAQMGKSFLTKPVRHIRDLVSRDWGQRSFALLFMQHLNSTVSLRTGPFGMLASSEESGEAPSANIPVSNELTRRVEKLIDGTSYSISTEAVLGTPTTAHILGGCVMSESAETGVIDQYNRVFNYQNLYVCDGSAVSSNPGVNPSLSITAITERAMSYIPVARSIESRSTVSNVIS